MADLANDRVQILTPDGDPISSFSTGAGPADVAIDSTGTIYVANQNADNVQKFGSSGMQVLPGFRSSTRAASPSTPTTTSMSPTGDTIECRSSTRPGVHEADWGGVFGPGPGEFKFPSGVEVFGTTLYVADSGNDRVQRLEHDPPVCLSASGGRLDTMFDGPIAVALIRDTALRSSSRTSATTGCVSFDAVGDPEAPSPT